MAASPEKAKRPRDASLKRKSRGDLVDRPAVFPGKRRLRLGYTSVSLIRKCHSSVTLSSTFYREGSDFAPDFAVGSV
jgi:hypothetical protein